MKMKQINRLIVLIIINSFFLVQASWAGEALNLSEKQSCLRATLSPQVLIGMAQFHELFTIQINSKSRSNDLKHKIKVAAKEDADNLDDAYKELDNLLRNKLKTTNTSLLISIDGGQEYRQKHIC